MGKGLNSLPTDMFGLRDTATGSYTRMSMTYDHAGNTIDACTARQVAEEPAVACGPGAHFATHSAYDRLDRPTTVTGYRETVNGAGVKTGGFSPNYGMEHNLVRGYAGYQPVVLPGEASWWEALFVP